MIFFELINKFINELIDILNNLKNWIVTTNSQINIKNLKKINEILNYKINTYKKFELIRKYYSKWKYTNIKNISWILNENEFLLNYINSFKGNEKQYIVSYFDKYLIEIFINKFVDYPENMERENIFDKIDDLYFFWLLQIWKFNKRYYD